MPKYQKYFIGVIALTILAVIINATMKLTLGLDIDGGIRVVMQADPQRKSQWSNKRADRMEKLESIRKTITNRVKGLQGVAEPVVYIQGDDKVVVELPGVKNPEAALKRIKKTASLEFFWLKDIISSENPSGRWDMQKTPGDENEYVFSGPRGETLNSIKQPEQVIAQVVRPDENPPILTGGDILPSSKTGRNPNGQIVINIEFNSRGTRIFRDFTSRHVGEYLAIFFDGRLLTAPTINEPIPNGKAEISGFRSLAEAKQTADLLNAGALPVPLKVIAKDTVEPTLGRETMKQVLLAGIVGLALVVLFMLVYYRLPGLIADIALGLYALLVVAVFKLIGATMSLAGLAALIISIGMAVDANILIFERLKEELRGGKTLRAAIDAGFSRAFTAIFDSNMCTAITCAILMWYGSPAVQSFAFTLLIGVAVSMFTAITVTRTILHLLVGWEWAQKPSLYGLGTSWMSRVSANMDIVGKRTYYFILSAILIVPGLVVLGMYRLKPGIEFISGTSVQASFSRPVKLDELRSIAESYSGDVAPEVQLSRIDGEPKVAFIKTKPLDESTEAKFREELDRKIGIATREFQMQFVKPVTEAGIRSIVGKYAKRFDVAVENEKVHGADQQNVIIKLRFVPDAKWNEMREALNAKYQIKSEGQSSKAFDQVATVMPRIARELTTNAFWAVIFASAAIVVYLTFRFAIGGFLAGLKYGTCAVIALIHDTCFILGMFAILGKWLGWEVDSLFVTAVLTVIGFSVHDTIVVYDRIRENLRHRLRGESFEQLCNRSILQTLSRSINTSLTVVLTLVCLIALGGPQLRHFYVALLMGVVIGTYSSIFNATPLVIIWEKLSSGGKTPRKKPGQEKVMVEKPLVEKPAQSAIDLPTAVSVEETVVEETPVQGNEKPVKQASQRRRTTKKRRF